MFWAENEKGFQIFFFSFLLKLPFFLSQNAIILGPTVLSIYLCELVFRPIKVFELILKIDWFPVRQNFKKYKVWNIYSDCNRQPFKVAWKKFDVFTASLYFMRGAGIVSYSIHIKVGLLIMRITDIITSNGRGKWKL